jgi:hypothetical protein
MGSQSVGEENENSSVPGYFKYEFIEEGYAVRSAGVRGQ